MSFPEGFVWGTASSAYQTEGAVAEGGRGVSVWDTFCTVPGAIENGDTGACATDAYHRFAEDIALLQVYGIKAYRFSVAWPRIAPRGDTTWNPDGFAYYDAVVDACLAAGITPYLTLYHWDLPQPLEDAGGWQNPATAEAFAAYSAAVAAHFCGRVVYFITLNEPECNVLLGYARGVHAPGRQLSLPRLFACWHNLLLAHGLAASAIRQVCPGAQVGIATTGRLCYPAAQTPQDEEAARAATFAVSDEDWMFTHTMVLDPVCLGHYPVCGGVLGACVEQVPAKEMQIIHAPPDFIGLNIYNGSEVFADETGGPVYAQKYAGYPRTALKWPVTPAVMEWGVQQIWQRYGLPLYITENGQSCNDRIFLDGGVHDADRIDFLQRYLLALERAVQAGADVRGYFHWSWTDNFEWHSGYAERFGLVYVDYPTQRRIPKDSCIWYAQLASTGGQALHSPGL